MEKNNEQKIINYKLIIVGDSCVGKTSFIHRLLTGEFIKQYIPNKNLEVKKIEFNSENYKFLFEIWILHENMEEIKIEYFIDVDCVIILCDSSSKVSVKNVATWYNKILKCCGNSIPVPVLIVGNKADIKGDIKYRSNSKNHSFTFFRKNSLKYIEISAKSSYRVEDPFLYFCRMFLKNPQLNFTYKYGILEHLNNLNNINSTTNG